MARGRRPGSGVSRAPAGEGAGTRGRRSPIDMSPKSVARREKRKLYMRQYRARRRLVDEAASLPGPPIASPAQPAAAFTSEAPHTDVQPLIRGHRACPVASLGVDVTELALCDNEDDDDAGPSMLEYSSMWEQLPQDVMERIGMLLPASSQARLRCVSKNWNQLVTSSAFRDESNLLAFHRGQHNFRCYLYTLEPSQAGNYGEGVSHEVDIPGTTPAGLSEPYPKVFCGAGLVGVAELTEESLNCWLVNMANKTSCALPRLPLFERLEDDATPDWEGIEWKIWLEPIFSSTCSTLISGFQVFFMVVLEHPINLTSSSLLFTYSSNSTGWRTLRSRFHPSSWWPKCVRTKGGFLGCNSRKLARISWDSGCITQLPDAPPPLGESEVKVISDPGSGAVFGYQLDDCSPLLVLHRLDESSSAPGWTRVYSGLPSGPEFQHLLDKRVHVRNVTFLANMLVILFHICSYSYSRSSYGLAYHMQDGSCRWFRLPDALVFCHSPYAWDTTTVVLDPTVVSQLRL